MTLYWTNPKTAQDIVNIVASIDAYSKKTYDMEAVTANYSHTQPTLTTLSEIGQKIDKVKAEIAGLKGHPGAYLNAMVKAFDTLVRYLADEKYSYYDAVVDVLEVKLRKIPDENFLQFTERIDKKLTMLGYSGAVSDKIKRWQDERRIPANEVTATAAKFLEKSRIYTAQRVRKLPESETIESINPVQGVYWSGQSEYLDDFKGRLTFNIDRPWNTPTFACILTHEAYPGHHTYYALWDYLYQEGKLPMEAAYYLINSPVNCLFEGAPEMGVRFLGWDDPNVDTPEITSQEKEEIQLAKDIMDLQRMYQTNASFFYNVEGWGKDEVIRYMLGTGWYSEVEANNTFRYFSNYYKRIYYPCYYYGRWIIQQAYDLFPKDKKEQFFEMIYDTPQTNSTLINAVREATGVSDFDPFISC